MSHMSLLCFCRIPLVVFYEDDMSLSCKDLLILCPLLLALQPIRFWGGGGGRNSKVHCTQICSLLGCAVLFASKRNAEKKEEKKI